MLVKQCSKFSKPGFSSMWTLNFQIFKLVLEKAEEPEIKLPTSAGSSEKQEVVGGFRIGNTCTLWRIHVDVWQSQYNIVKKKLNNCREPAWGIPPVAKVMRKGAWQNAKAGSGLRAPHLGFSRASTPRTKICLLYCIMPFTNSSDSNRELSSTTFFWKKLT